MADPGATPLQSSPQTAAACATKPTPPRTGGAFLPRTPPDGIINPPQSTLLRIHTTFDLSRSPYAHQPDALPTNNPGSSLALPPHPQEARRLPSQPRPSHPRTPT